MSPDPPSQKAQRFVGLTKTIVRTLRYGPREIALATGGFVALGFRLVLPKAETMPELLQPYWPWVPAGLSLLGIGLLSGCVVLIYRKVTAPLPEVGEPKPSAIKGAASFGPQDGELFSRLGRDADIAKLRGWILDDQVPLVAIMGESGVGKTSLLRSGLPYNLRDEDVRVVYWEAVPTDPITALLHSVRASLPADPQTPESLNELLAKDGFRQVIVIDQAEQLSPETHPKFFALLCEVISAYPPYRTTWVVAFRREYMSTWRDFEIDLSAAEQQRVATMSLRRFPRETAERVVATLVEESSLPIEQKVVSEIIESVAEAGHVSPVDIGISLLALSEFAVGRDSYSLVHYKNAGGQTGLLTGYLERLLEGFSESESSELFQGLTHLIHIESDQRFAEGRSAKELIELVNPVQATRFRRGLDYLASSKARILELVSVNHATGFRLVHERMIPAIRRLSGILLAEADRARLDLDRAFQVYTIEKSRRFLLSGRRLKQIVRYRSQLGLGQESAKFEFVDSSLRKRAFVRAFVAVAAAMLLSIGTYVSIRVEEEVYRANLRAWGLPADLFKVQRQLTELAIRGNQIPVTRLDWLRGGLIELKLDSTPISSLDGLPSSLNSLVLDLRGSQVSSLKYLPPRLSSLVLDISGTQIESLEELPPTLSSLVLDIRGTQIESLEGLPPTLSSLELHLKGSKVSSLKYLPPRLSSLDLNPSDENISDLEDLPPLLRSLILRSSMREISSLGSLPPKLTSLELDLGWTNISSLEGLPSSLNSLKLDLKHSKVSSFGGLPPKLSSLTLRVGSYQKSHLEDLPPSLSSLDLDLTESKISSLEGLPPDIASLTLRLSRFQISGVEGLPRRLSSLVLNLRECPVSSLKGLPPTLESLELALMLSQVSGFEEGMGPLISSDEDEHSSYQKEAFEGLRHVFCSLTLLRSLTIRITDSYLVPNLAGLPPTLNSLVLDLGSSNMLSLDGLPLTLNSLELTLRRAKVSSLEGLPHGLKSLDINLSGATVSSLEGLPSSVKSLNLIHTDINQVQQLPEGLHELTVGARQFESLQELPPSVRILRFYYPG